MIVYNAHRINRGESPRLNAKGSDFFFERASSPTDAAKRIVALCSTRLPGFLGLESREADAGAQPDEKGRMRRMDAQPAFAGRVQPSRARKARTCARRYDLPRRRQSDADPQQLPAQVAERGRFRRGGRSRAFSTATSASSSPSIRRNM